VTAGSAQSRRGSPAGAAAALTPGGRKLVLIGYMGAGKSTAARLLAVRLGSEFVDADIELERRLGQPIAEYFDREGEKAFREQERVLVLELLDADGPSIVALGGGAVTSHAVRSSLARHVTVYLEVDADDAWRRAQKNSERPLARDRQEFTELLDERIPLYESTARATVPAGRMDETDRALAAALVLAREQVPASVRMIWASVENRGYPVYLGRGATHAAGVLWREGPPGDARCFVVADRHVQDLHGDRLRGGLGERVEPTLELVVEPGEQHKTLAEAERLMRELAAAGMRRDDATLALGGGVVGDLAGFCAGTYQRGTPIVHVPSTLVAQVDSAYGGKTGVDLPEAKNYVGVFHQPTMVVVDPDLLRTLPAAESAAGFAEVVKTGLIAGGVLWEQVITIRSIAEMARSGSATLVDVIERCARTKLAIVRADERDHGLRASLNLGHTFAHALEAATGYSVYGHGEAVALGLLVALRLSEAELGLDPAVRVQVIELLSAAGLPTSFSGPSTDELLARAGVDKKVSAGRRNLVLLRAPGDVVTGCELDDKRLLEAIDEIREGGGS
jgi:shikimate kinase/3-dehydroquinate synthase